MTAQTVSNAVATRQEGPVAIMWSRKKHFDAVLPASVDVEAFLGTAAGALYANAMLMEYAQANPDSLVVALMKCAALGHMPGTDEYYLTPRKDHGRPKVLGIEGYRGVIERMYRSGAVSKVVVREVCANDKFRYVEGVDDKPVHEFGGAGGTGADFFAKRDRGEMVGIYAYAELVTGAVSRVVLLTADDVLAARDSGGYRADDKFTPWNRLDGGAAHPEFKGRSMWWKTGAKRLEPWVPTSAEYRRESLRASASAAELASGRPRLPELPPSGAAVQPGDTDYVDAEIVDETDVPPAGEQGSPGPAEPAPTPAGPAGGTPGDERHRGLVGVAQQHFKRLGYSDADKEARLRDATDLVLGTDVPTVSSLNDLTHAELNDLNRVLEKHKDRASLRKMLASGEVPGE
jgi:recombination protein RecT